MNLYYFGQSLNLASLYMLAALADALIIKSGRFNLGGEGQIYAGGFVCAITLNLLKNTPFIIAVSLALLFSFMVSALMSFLSALMQRYKKADFLFTSFLISLSVIPVIDGLIAGPFRSREGNLLATAFINHKFEFFSILQPSSLNLTFIFSILLCLLSAYFIYKTRWGQQICIYGKSRKFASYIGYDGNKIENFSAIISGGLHGLCGAFAVCGTYYTCHLGFYAGMGWNGLCVCLIAGANPLFIIPASIAMGFIKICSDNYAMYSNAGYDISSLIQALIIFIFAMPYENIFSIFKNLTKRRCA